MYKLSASQRKERRRYGVTGKVIVTIGDTCVIRCDSGIIAQKFPSTLRDKQIADIVEFACRLGDYEIVYNKICQCADPLCPVCTGKCHNRATETLYRVDMEDETGTAFCYACASDAYDSGLFNSETYNDESGDDNER